MTIEIGGFLALATLMIGLFAWLRQDMGELRREIGELRREIGGLRREMDGLRGEIAELRERMARLEGLLDGLREAVAARARPAAE